MPDIAAVEDESSPHSSVNRRQRPWAPAHLAAYVWMLIGAVAFAVMGILTHAAGENADWRVIATVRTCLAFLFAALISRAYGTRLVFRGTPTLWMRSLAGSVSLLGTFYALSHLPVADALTLTNMFPLWVAFLSWPMLGRLPEGGVWLAALCAVGGVAIMQGPHFTESNLAVFAAILSSFTSAVAMIGLHRLHWMPPQAIVAHFSMVGILFGVGSLLVPPGPGSILEGLDWTTALEIVGVGLTATIGQLCITRAFATGVPAKISVVALTQVVFAFAFEMAIFHRTASVGTLVGIALVLAPTAWVMLRRPGGRP